MGGERREGTGSIVSTLTTQTDWLTDWWYSMVFTLPPNHPPCNVSTWQLVCGPALVWSVYWGLTEVPIKIFPGARNMNYYREKILGTPNTRGEERKAPSCISISIFHQLSPHYNTLRLIHETWLPAQITDQVSKVFLPWETEWYLHKYLLVDTAEVFELQKHNIYLGLHPQQDRFCIENKNINPTSTAGSSGSSGCNTFVICVFF